MNVVDVLPALKGEDSSVGRRGDPNNPRLSACGFVDAPSALRAGCGGLGIRSEWPAPPNGGAWPPRPSRVVGHGPRHRPFSTVEATWSRPTRRGLLFGCRRDAVAAASDTPPRERYDSLRRPGGTQSNRQFLPLLDGLLSDARRHKRWESGANVYGAYPRPNGRGFAPVFHIRTRKLNRGERVLGYIGPLA